MAAAMYSELLKHQLLDDVEKVSRSVLLLELRLDDGYVSMIALPQSAAAA